MDLPTIQKRIELIDKLTEENRVSSEMLKSELETDPDYNQIQTQWKELNSKKKRLKDELLSKGSNQELSEKIKENKGEITVNKEILSQELIALYQTSRTNEVYDTSGQMRKFKLSVSLSSKRLID